MTNRQTTEVGLHRHLMEHLSTAVALLDERMRVLYLNPAAEMLLATSMGKAKGRVFPDCVGGDDELARALEWSLADGSSLTRRRARLVTAPDREVTVDYTVTPLHPRVLDAALLVELQQLDRILRISREEGQLHAREATRALVRGVAHELKNPLGGIRGSAQLLERSLPDPELAEYTRVIIDEADRLRNLADRMLGSRRQPQFAPVNVHECLEHVRHLALAEQPDRVRVERDYDPSLPEVPADRDQIIQVLLNLVRNAIQAMVESDTPQPRLLLRTRVLRQYTIASERHRLVVAITVEDNGPGIPEELRGTLFYPMVSGRAHGSGLGLAIAQSIVSQHRGLLECESEPGHTRFTLLLPLEQPDSESEAQ